MRRLAREPRAGWENIVQAQGLSYYLTEGRPYWDDSAYYEFTSDEIDTLEAATYALDKMCLEAIEQVISRNLWSRFLIPPEFIPFVKQSWETDEHTIYGRFDFVFDGGTPRLLEYNADTPTALIEAAVIQWYWLQDIAGGDDHCDQFNSIHERLVEAWQAAGPDVDGTLYFTSLPTDEDFMTVSYLRDTAMQAGLDTEFIEISQIGWNSARMQFVDLQERPMRHIFKLYPWEWLVREQFAPQLLHNTASWLEAPWKMLLSNKAILPLLWQMFPDNPYLLPAAYSPSGNTFVKKPILAREGANTEIVVKGDTILQTDGLYEGPFVYQDYAPLPDFDGNYPVVGSWMVNGWACGVGIREDSTLITGNASRFVPHLFVK